MTASRPRPIPTAFSRFYWDAARAGKLLVQHCEDCGFYLHPPGPVCPRCRSRALSPAEVTGRARVHAFTIVRHVFHPALADEVPYVVARVELDEQPDLVLVTNIVGCAPETVRLGMKVRVLFEQRGEDVLPQFTPAE